MATFPTSKVHRVSRRKLGRGQYPSQNGVAAVLTDATTTLTITFARPVVVTGRIPTTTNGAQTFVSQTVVSPTVVTQLWSATLVGSTITLPAGAANVATYQGGPTLGAVGTF